MHRKIKFRIWSQIRKNWERDTYIENEIPNIDNARLDLTPTNDDDQIWEQFTGLVDKNGVEIYEEDILSIQNETQRKYENGKVIWSAEYFTYLVKFGTEQVYYSLYLSELQNKKMDFAVVGNLHQNPELLK